ncbi:golgin subfamily A member 6-like protein 22 [Macrobrachium nipponense]|uniref:golgin subfamily A member 6-like protein 22 n=1 Tax=Macrobrachium nipponense TaxID=159736 RepID=UPI0030C898C5
MKNEIEENRANFEADNYEKDQMINKLRIENLEQEIKIDHLKRTVQNYEEQNEKLKREMEDMMADFEDLDLMIDVLRNEKLEQENTFWSLMRQVQNCEEENEKMKNEMEGIEQGEYGNMICDFLELQRDEKEKEMQIRKIAEEINNLKEGIRIASPEQESELERNDEQGTKTQEEEETGEKDDAEESDDSDESKDESSDDLRADENQPGGEVERVEEPEEEDTFEESVGEDGDNQSGEEERVEESGEASKTQVEEINLDGPEETELDSFCSESEQKLGLGHKAPESKGKEMEDDMSQEEVEELLKEIRKLREEEKLMWEELSQRKKLDEDKCQESEDDDSEDIFLQSMINGPETQGKEDVGEQGQQERTRCQDEEEATAWHELEQEIIGMRMEQEHMAKEMLEQQKKREEMESLLRFIGGDTQMKTRNKKKHRKGNNRRRYQWK